jgi:hypothetical protein
MLAFASMDIDYSTQVYYNLTLGVLLFNRTDWGKPECDTTPCWTYQQMTLNDTTSIYVTATLVYDPADEYNTEANPSVTTNFRSDDGIYFKDYYNFAVFQDGVPVLWPAAGGAYGFNGPGPQRDISFSTIFLGTLNALFSYGTMHGPPDHLKLVSDTYPQSSCGSVRRWLKFKVVDSMGRYAGRVNVEETFESTTDPMVGYQSIYNSCQNDNYRPARCSGMDLDGTFTDQLWVGCPSAGGECGFPTVASRWWWCRPGASFGSVSLTRNVYEVRHNRALVNGSAGPFIPGTDFR